MTEANIALAKELLKSGKFLEALEIYTLDEDLYEHLNLSNINIRKIIHEYKMLTLPILNIIRARANDHFSSPLWKCLLGEIYQYGMGVEPINSDMSEHWFLEASKYGSRYGECFMGNLYWHQYKYPKLAIPWFQNAFKKGSKYASKLLYECLLELDQFECAHKHMGEMLTLAPTTKYGKEASAIYYNWAFLNLNGLGCKKDNKEAQVYFEKNMLESKCSESATELVTLYNSQYETKDTSNLDNRILALKIAGMNMNDKISCDMDKLIFDNLLELYKTHKNLMNWKKEYKEAIELTCQNDDKSNSSRRMGVVLLKILSMTNPEFFSEHDQYLVVDQVE